MAAPETSTCEPWATIADVQSPCDDYASADRDTDAQDLRDEIPDLKTERDEADDE